MVETVKTEQKKEKIVYTKDQILASAKYCNRSDLADALLEEGKTYTLEEVDQMMAKYLKGKVK